MSEYVAGINWNWRQVCAGMGGRNRWNQQSTSEIKPINMLKALFTFTEIVKAFLSF